MHASDRTGVKVYDELEDPDVIRRVNVHFYDLVYDDPWLGQFFASVEKEHIVAQQTDFMTGALGGPRRFSGRVPSEAHPHLMVTDELFDLRQSLLEASFAAVGAPMTLVEAWRRIDEAHRGTIVKNDVSECRPRWRTDPILDVPRPGTRRHAG